MFKTPDITAAQVVAIVTSVIGVIVAAGVPMSTALQSAIIGFVTVVAAALIVGDSQIRKGRALGNAQKK